MLLEAFQPGDGQRLHDGVTGDWPTGEKKPRKLPKEVANEMAHHINGHRHSARIVQPGYVLQRVAVGSPHLHWTLQKISAQAGRLGPLHGPAGLEAKTRCRNPRRRGRGLI